MHQPGYLSIPSACVISCLPYVANSFAYWFYLAHHLFAAPSGSTSCSINGGVALSSSSWSSCSSSCGCGCCCCWGCCRCCCRCRCRCRRRRRRGRGRGRRRSCCCCSGAIKAAKNILCFTFFFIGIWAGTCPLDWLIFELCNLLLLCSAPFFSSDCPPRLFLGFATSINIGSRFVPFSRGLLGRSWPMHTFLFSGIFFTLVSGCSSSLIASWGWPFDVVVWVLLFRY